VEIEIKNTDLSHRVPKDQEDQKDKLAEEEKKSGED
jgi:hypothetical protein